MNATKRRPWRTLLFLLLCSALAGLIAFGLWPGPLPVDTAPVVTAPMTVSVTEEGKTRIRSRYMIYPPAAGYLQRVELRAGEPVRAGETVLATLVPEAAAFLTPRARAEAQARVQAAEASTGLREAEVRRVRASLDLARKDLGRISALLKDGAVATQDWDRADSEVRVLERERQAAVFALQAAQSEAEAARAVLSRAAVPGQSESLPILAPVDGYVLSVMEENARAVSPATPIMEVGDPGDLEIEIELLSSDAVAVDAGAEVLIEHWGGEKPLKGRVVMVERGGFTKVSAIGVEEQRVKIRAELLDPLPQGRVLGDRFGVQAGITTWRADKVLQVPSGALFRHGGAWKAYVLKSGRATLRTVEIGHENGLTAEIRSGLSEGETVVLHPPDTLADGMRVSRGE